jgi:tetratricopeptide (TPR) repeat protein
MKFRHQLAFALLLFLTPCACAQVGTAGMDPAQFGNVHVHVVYPSDRSAGLHLRVRLLSGGSMPIAESLTNDQGIAEFTGVPIGNYHIIVSGEGIQETDSGDFEVDRRKTSQDLFITVHGTSSNANLPVGGPHSVAAVDMNVPPAALKEFDQASKAMANQDWAKAIQRLKRAISIYPQYAPAYNNMGVAYGRLNQPAEERAALEKAVSLNDHFVPAFVNLAKLSLREHDSARAETLLENAVRADPTNVETLMLLAEAQLLNKHHDAAVATARTVHSLPHQKFAVVHYIAARAFEHEHRLQDALVELQMFLTEEPQGARADHVRDEIARLKSRQP